MWYAMVGVVGWLTSHDIRQHLQDLMLFLCSKVNHGHSLFGHRILSEQQTKILKHPAKCRRFPKTCRIFFAELGTRITRTSNNKKRWRGINIKIQNWHGFVGTESEGFCPKKHLEISVIHCMPYLRSGLALYLDHCEREYQIPRSIE